MEQNLDRLRKKRPLAAQLFHVQKKPARTERRTEQLVSELSVADEALAAAQAKRRELAAQLEEAQSERDQALKEHRALGGESQSGLLEGQ
eukprot:4914900-Amphidinium_carterae.1